MLRSTPFHRDDYSRLIISVINKFFHRCQERFKGECVDGKCHYSHSRAATDLTAQDSTEMHADTQGAAEASKMAAVWSQRPTLAAVLSQLLEHLVGKEVRSI